MSRTRLTTRTLDYHAFLLRLSRRDGNEPWQIVAQDIETGEEFPCADLQALVALLAEHVPIVRPAR